MYASMCYQACLDGVHACLDYEKNFPEQIMNESKLPIELSKLISEYYDPYSEYSHAMGHTTSNDD